MQTIGLRITKDFDPFRSMFSTCNVGVDTKRRLSKRRLLKNIEKTSNTAISRLLNC